MKERQEERRSFFVWSGSGSTAAFWNWEREQERRSILGAGAGVGAPLLWSGAVSTAHLCYLMVKTSCCNFFLYLRNSSAGTFLCYKQLFQVILIRGTFNLPLNNYIYFCNLPVKNQLKFSDYRAIDEEVLTRSILINVDWTVQYTSMLYFINTQFNLETSMGVPSTNGVYL